MGATTKTKHTENLSPEQKKIVMHDQGPAFVLGVAGSGKTCLIHHRVIHLLKSRKIPPARILVFVSNSRMARKIKSELADSVSMDISALQMGTLHSVCLDILREDIHQVGYDTSFGIFDTADRYTLIKECLTDLNFDLDKTHPSMVSARISQAKNMNFSPVHILNDAQTFSDRKIAKTYRMYQNRLRMLNSLDFDDLLMLVHELFSKHPDTLSKYQERWDHVILDDFQDMSQVQLNIVSMIATKHGNIMVMGDEDEAIYQWRGADPSSAETFRGYFPGVTEYFLNRNFRSSKYIAQVSYDLIDGNTNRVDKKMVPTGKKGKKIKLVVTEDERNEAKFIAETITELRESRKYSFKDFSVLYRTNVQSRIFESVFDESDIPYKIISGLGFFSKREIKDILGYFRIIVNPGDDINLKRMLNIPPRGIGILELKKIEMLAKKEKTSFHDALRKLLDKKSADTKKQAGLREFMDLLDYFIKMNEKKSVSKMLDLILEKTGYENMIRDEGTVESEIRLENVKLLKKVIRDFRHMYKKTTVCSFLDWVSLLNQTDMYDQDENVVTLMTFHCAKGLQFPVVFLAGMEEGLCPHRKSASDNVEMEEERRLCFMGMTRAIEDLYCTCSQKRQLYGSVQTNQPSRFITEVSEAFVEEKFYTPQNAVRSKSIPQIEEKIRRKSVFKIGMTVRHPKWGIGTVMEIFESGLETKLLINFEGIGNKKLIDKFVQPEILNATIIE